MKIVIYAPELELPMEEFASRGIELREAGLGPEPEKAGATGVLAARLVEWERLLERQAPDGLVLAGDGDTTLAGALSAAKLEVPVAAAGAGELVRLLASLAVDQHSAASEIARWAESLPTLPPR